MSTRHPAQIQTRTHTRTDATTESTPATSSQPTRAATTRAQAMFSHRNTDRLENLIDECNAAFAPADS